MIQLSKSEGSHAALACPGFCPCYQENSYPLDLTLLYSLSYTPLTHSIALISAVTSDSFA
jgi:hypothetical protein